MFCFYSLDWLCESPWCLGFQVKTKVSPVQFLSPYHCYFSKFLFDISCVLYCFITWLWIFFVGSRLSLKSNLIDKWPPIESIARTLSWDDSCANVASPYPLKPSLASLDPKVEDQDWFVFVDKLLSIAGVDDQVQTDSFYARWHSLKSPLDPSLRDKYANLDDTEPQQLHQAKRRQKRSNQKLVFDSVNIALIEITGYVSEKNYLMGSLCSGSHSRVQLPEAAPPPPLVDLIVAQMKELISSAMRSIWVDCGDSNSPALLCSTASISNC